jgi:hypothetical protein
MLFGLLLLRAKWLRVILTRRLDPELKYLKEDYGKW